LLIYLLDDSKIALIKLENYLRQYAAEIGMPIEIKAFQNSLDFLYHFENDREKPYLVFLDIYMEDVNGMDFAKDIRRIEKESFRLIFTTSSDEFALDAFEVFADGYIKKPYEYEDLKRALARLESRFRNESNVIVLHSIRQDMALHVANILYAETANHKVDIHMENDVVTASMSMKDLEELLCRERGFISCGQSYIINMARVKAISRDTIIMEDENRIVIPVRLRKTIISQINDYRNE